MYCPHCNSSRIRRTGLQATEFYYLLLLQRPYECVGCGERFFRPSMVGAAFLRSWFDEGAADPADPHEVHASAKPYELNRRAWVRFFTDLSASCEGTANGKHCHWPGRIQDISRGGAMLLFYRAFEKGTTVHVRLDGVPDEAPKVLIGQVIHCEQQEDGRWAVGCKFQKRLTCEELEVLLS
jgi:hypothetical protein